MIQSILHGNIHRNIPVIIAFHPGCGNLQMGDRLHFLKIKSGSLRRCMQVHFTQQAVLIQ